MEVILLALWAPIILAGLVKVVIVTHNMVNNLNETHEALSKCDFKS